MSVSIKHRSFSATSEKMHLRNRHIQQYRPRKLADRLYCAQQYCAA
jgi:hypothetical protein